MRLKNLSLAAPGCHLGITCVGTGGCGLLRMTRGTVGAPGQVVSDRVCVSDTLFQVFSNVRMGCASPTCGMIAHPGSGFDCSESFVPPILPDADLDGEPSCAPGCRVDADDVAAVCGVTLPLPDCDPDRDVSVLEDADCLPWDVVPGNERCDLAPGAYGAIRIASGGRLDFAAGETVICSLKARNAVRLTSAGPARVVVAGRGKVSINDAADVGGDCGDLRIVSERGLIRFGRHGEFNLDA